MDRDAIRTEWTETPSRARLLRQYASGTYKLRNIELAKWVAEANVSSVVEVAAGCYDLIRRIRDLCKPRLYLWSDGDDACYRAGRRYIPDGVRKRHCRACATARLRMACEFTALKLRPFDALICVSTEHLPDDVGLVSRTAPGTQVFLCGANFPSQWHVRHWQSVGEMAARYPMLDVKRTLTIGPDGVIDDGPLPAGCKFLLWGERK